MTQPPTTRWRLLAAGGAASLAALAGCSGILGDDDSDASGDLDAVPTDTELLVSVDVQQVLNDDLLASFVLGFGSTQQQRPVPRVGFEFNYDDAAGTVTITHTAGDTIRADRLYVYGDAVNGSWLDLGGDAPLTQQFPPATQITSLAD